MSWGQFLKLHWQMLAGTDFFTVEVATLHGLVSYDVPFVMELATRRVPVTGMTPHPTDAFMVPCAWQLTDPWTCVPPTESESESLWRTVCALHQREGAAPDAHAR